MQISEQNRLCLGDRTFTITPTDGATPARLTAEDGKVYITVAHHDSVNHLEPGMAVLVDAATGRTLSHWLTGQDYRVWAIGDIVSPAPMGPRPRR